MPALEARDLSKWFGGLAALDGLDLAVGSGEILGLIGPNGAGKSTALGVMTGFHSPTRGRVLLGGADVTASPPNHRARAGLARVFQQNLLFASCTVFESVQIGAHLQLVGSGLGAARRALSWGARREVAATVAEVLDVVGLGADAEMPARNLPHGRKRLLGLAVALAGRPRVLLLDEPLTGMNAEETSAMLDLIRSLSRERGIAFVLVEHNMDAVMKLCDRICVLHFGRRLAYGSPAEVCDDPAVIDAYLGAATDGPDGH
jgi:ABC-type branched-subunit amino acid transport system ATPase component